MPKEKAKAAGAVVKGQSTAAAGRLYLAATTNVPYRIVA